MEQKVPNVNFMLEFCLPKYNDEKLQDKRNYYSSRKSNDYIKYISTGIKDLKNIDFVEYANNNTKTSGIFNENGKMNSKQIKEVRQHLRETESVIWSGVVSFEEAFGKKWCSNHYQAENIIQTELPKFFKSAGLKPENMEWFAGLHENTDNRHIHIIFFEKQPIRIKGKKRAFSIGKLSTKAMDKFKLNMELCATDYKAREIRIRTELNKETDELLNGNISSSKLKNMLISLANNLPSDSHMGYGYENMSNLILQVDEITNYIFSKNKNIRVYKEEFDDIVAEKDEALNSYTRRNGYEKPTVSVGEKMLKDLYRRVGNKIITKAKELKKEENERLKFNAKYKMEKRLQKQKLMQMLNECMLLNKQVEYESIKAFQDYLTQLKEAHISRLIEEGYIDRDELEM